MNRRILAFRVVSASVAVLGILGLIAVWNVGPARADTPVDQITGNGSTDSAVTVRWDQGLVGPDNKTTVTPRDQTSPYAFMNPDFQHLAVTISQSQNLVHQSIKVTWTGGKGTNQDFREDFLQMMQCYGDADTGPTPEQCEFGSFGLLPGGQTNANIGQRGGIVCSTPSPSTQSPPAGLGGVSPALGCDPQEPSDPSHTDPTQNDNTRYSVPFIPVGLPEKVYGHSTEWYDQFNTNEVQTANTRPDGTGQVFFQTETATQAPGLGCGLRESDGQIRNCWLVIVPRGEYEPNGWKMDNGLFDNAKYIYESPLGKSSWAQRIQIHLGFDPLQPPCPIGSAKERGTIGTELVSHAVFSWQLALNTAANCKTLYGYAPASEALNTAQLADPGGVGLAFTTVPIGDEDRRAGTSVPTLPPLLYAPITATALTFGFNVNQGAGFRDTPVKLTPRLVAKALTQSYRFDLPDVDSNHPGPTWAKNNPAFITQDPEFTKLNPDISTPASGSPIAPLVTEDVSGANKEVWAWLLSDTKARDWLKGAPDENGMVVNPAYPPLVGKAPIDSFPRADPTCFNTAPAGQPEHVRCSLDLLPYVNNYDDAAGHVRAGSNPEGASWDSTATSPSGTPGWWGRGGVEPAGATLMWGLMGSDDMANYGLVPADLCDSSGANCVSASTASVATALATAKPDSSGLLHVDPGAPGSGGYPLVQLSYAAVRTTSDPNALVDYATFINYAAGQGQTAGVDPGQLPHGYLPLPANLRAAAQAVASRLLTIASATPTPTATGATTPAGPTGTNAATGAPAAGATPLAASASASTLSYTTTQVSAEPAAKTTSPTPVGAVRWALISVVVAGLVGSVGGPLLRVSFGSRATPWRQP